MLEVDGLWREYQTRGSLGQDSLESPNWCWLVSVVNKIEFFHEKSMRE